MSFLNNYLSGMDEDQARAMLDQLDDEQVEQAIQWIVDESVVPHLMDVRQRARQATDPNEVRRELEDLPESVKEELFYDTLHELIAILVTCRERPNEGFEELKTVLRDPYTVESLLLIFENDQHIDDEYSNQLKDFAANHLQWVGAMVLPEMYDERTVEEVVTRFTDVDPEDVDTP